MGRRYGAGMPPSDPHAAVDPARAERVYTPRILGLFVAAIAYFTTTGVSFPVLPRLVERELGGSEADIGLAFAFWALGMLFMRPIGGLLSDRIGRRPLIIGGSLAVALLQLAHPAAAETGQLWVLFAVRIATGAARSVMYLGQATMATELPPSEHRDRVFAAFSTIILIGFAIGQVAGEWAFQEWGFWAAFGFSAGCSFLATLVGLTLPETRPSTVVVRPGIRNLVHPVAARVGVVALVIFIAFMGFNGFITDYGEEFGLEEARWLLLTYTITTIGMRAVSGKVFASISRRRLTTFAFSVVAVGALVLALATESRHLYLGAFVMAVGMAWVVPLLILIAVDSTPDDDRSRVVATVTMFNDVASSVGAFLLGIVAEVAGYDGMYVTVTCGAVLALILVRSPFLWSLKGFNPEAPGPALRAAPRSG